MRVALQPADTKIQAWFAKSVVVILVPMYDNIIP
jgi:hypothetical protein